MSMPGLQDDFYVNLLDWSNTNLLVAGVGESVYVWSSNNNAKLIRVGNGPTLVSSVTFSQSGNQIGYANYDSTIAVKDLQKNMTLYKSFGEHSGRIGSLSFSGSCIASGGRDGRIVIHDIRAGLSCFRYQGH